MDEPPNYNGNVVEIALRHYQLFLQHPSLSSFVCKINFIRECHKGPIAIGGPVLNYLGPPDVILPFLL